MTKKELQKYFERKYLKGTCFDSLEELLDDKTDHQFYVIRCLVAVNLCGVWRGLNDDKGAKEDEE